MLPRLSLLDGRVDVDTEVHLPLVLVRQQEQPHDGVVGDLVVERLAVEVDEGGEHLDVVPASRGQAMDLPEDGDGVSGDGRHDVGLLDDVALEQLGGVVIASQLAGGDVEPGVFLYHGVILIIIVVVNIITSSRPS